MKFISKPDLDSKTISKLLLKKGYTELETYLVIEESYSNAGEMYFAITHFMNEPVSMSYKTPIRYNIDIRSRGLILIVADSCAVELKGKVFIEGESIIDFDGT